MQLAPSTLHCDWEIPLCQLIEMSDFALYARGKCLTKFFLRSQNYWVKILDNNPVFLNFTWNRLHLIGPQSGESNQIFTQWPFYFGVDHEYCNFNVEVCAHMSYCPQSIQIWRSIEQEVKIIICIWKELNENS